MKIVKEIWLAGALLILGVTLAFGSTVNSGNPVPLIGNDEISAQFLANSILKSVASDLGLVKKEKKLFIETVIATTTENPYLPYARRLAKTLSDLTLAEQTTMWYGS